MMQAGDRKQGINKHWPNQPVQILYGYTALHSYDDSCVVHESFKTNKMTNKIKFLH